MTRSHHFLSVLRLLVEAVGHRIEHGIPSTLGVRTHLFPSFLFVPSGLVASAAGHAPHPIPLLFHLGEVEQLRTFGVPDCTLGEGFGLFQRGCGELWE